MPRSEPPPQDDRADAIAALRDWILWQGIQGAAFDELLEEISRQLVGLGVPLMRVHTTFRALHPTHGAIAHRWDNTLGKHSEAFGGGARVEWRSSPLYHMLAEDMDRMRIRLDDDAMRDRFPIFRDLHARGGTEYYARRIAFVRPEELPGYTPDDPPEGMMMSLTSNGADGFSDRDIDDIETLLPALAIVLKSTASRRMARDLLTTYLGPDAGKRVLSGEIDRGSVEAIRTAILYFDLQGFTSLSETLAPEVMIGLLNDYFGAVAAAVDAHSGNILKFMGDGLLAIFPDRGEGRLAAIDAVSDVRTAMAQITLQREAEGLPTTGFSAALHAGEVLYGNIGAPERLDFTVIGPAVNTAARIQGMCSGLGQDILISGIVAEQALSLRPALVSVGVYRLRGVAQRVELFTLD